MAAIWVSNSGVGTAPKRSTKISMSWRAAWNTFSTAGLASSSPSGVRSMPSACGVDHGDLVVAGELHDAELREVGAFAHELGIDGDERFGGEAAAERPERFGGGDQLRGGAAAREVGS